jgi:hypothetical protein
MTDAEILRSAAATLRVDARRAARGHVVAQGLATLSGAAHPDERVGADIARWLLEAAELCETVAELPDAMGRVDALLAMHVAGGSRIQRATWEWVAHTLDASEDGPGPGN